MAQILKAPSHNAERYNEAISSDRHANSICAKTGQGHTDKIKWSQQTGRRPTGLHRLNGDMKPTHRTERYEDGEPSTNDYDQQTQVVDSHTLIELKVDFFIGAISRTIQR